MFAGFGSGLGFGFIVGAAWLLAAPEGQWAAFW